ncbi:L-serine dehydratase [Pseudarcicella hirudinis]|uniref:L-serine dehydratase n=1 Tax=Pseudarcicella hirudinis TaxID=1079859 RepID=A0A1I5QL57_9BACT|nr:L-serine ammonia-lyase [Pseudarcicella hirudinis]SFP46952.1 L-serine dehydratase [Pseudarcicella hirudinis]
MLKNSITTSIFDLFKVGPGPSSSHTIGPMKAAYDFLREINKLPETIISDALSIHIHLYGSLSATGKGHGTDRAIVAGLSGWQPDACDPVKFTAILKDSSEKYPVNVLGNQVFINAENFFFEKGRYDSPHANTMVLRLLNGSEIILEHEYYSIGGGFIYRKGEKPDADETRQPRYSYASMKELKAHLEKEKISLTDFMIANEMALTGASRKEIERKIDTILDFMHKAVKRGLKDKHVLPGTIKLRRKAPLLYQKAKNLALTSDSFLIFLNAYCLAASEENAAGNIVVTAPTSGASGVIPGVTYLIKNHFHYSPQLMREGMLAAAAIGFLVKHNASISGAEMGCMGEIGSASAMAAAMLTYCATKNINAMEASAEIAIEHHLGMTCDPIGGYVQIPCIERNAMGAVKAYNAFLLATAGDSSLQKISLDSVIKVMKATGKDMSKKYKETSEAGLALSATEC